MGARWCRREGESGQTLKYLWCSIGYLEEIHIIVLNREFHSSVFLRRTWLTPKDGGCLSDGLEGDDSNDRPESVDSCTSDQKPWRRLGLIQDKYIKMEISWWLDCCNFKEFEAGWLRLSRKESGRMKC
ncbi:hypothetical protein L1987_40005 [Smallanthus sonchifolius]|uniref:Uncharacterized protein n=1 Tax=Smallanthus sonchifolius TaxID=185202 RepID=A0ACB9GS94_9ASTR|nr:hypothetical protein L1987_40005 [Smallanthus sonchifolius]